MNFFASLILFLMAHLLRFLPGFQLHHRLQRTFTRPALLLGVHGKQIWKHMSISERILLASDSNRMRSYSILHLESTKHGNSTRLYLRDAVSQE